MPSPEDFYPVVIIADRHYGEYSGGLWFAIAEADTPYHDVKLDPCRAAFCLEDGPNDEEDAVAAKFWHEAPDWIAAGDTPGEALTALMRRSMT